MLSIIISCWRLRWKQVEKLKRYVNVSLLRSDSMAGEKFHCVGSTAWCSKFIIQLVKFRTNCIIIFNAQINSVRVPNTLKNLSYGRYRFESHSVHNFKTKKHHVIQKDLSSFYGWRRMSVESLHAYQINTYLLTCE